MRFRGGFTPGAIPALRMLFVDRSADAATAFSSSPAALSSSLQTPDLPLEDRRFFYLNDPDHHDEAIPVAETIVIIGAGARHDARTALERRAGLMLAEPGVTDLPPSLPVLRIRDARAAVAAVVDALSHDIHHDAPFAAGEGNRVHPSAIVDGVLEGDVTVEAGAVVMAGAFIGRGTRIEAGAVIREHVIIGANTVIQSGVVVGGSGFGFYTDVSSGAPSPAPRPMHLPMPHRAGVLLGADCFVGANTVIAAGVLHPTTLGDGCKLDSHVQIAHNVRLGPGALMASQSGIAGSTIVGRGFRAGGASSIAGHLRLGDHVSVAAKAGVTKDVPDGLTVAGFPARPIAQWRREIAQTRRLNTQ